MSASSERFTPQFSLIARRWAFVLIVALAAGAVIIYLDEGAWPSGLVLAFTLGLMMLLYAVLLAVAWWKKPEWIEVSQEGVRVGRRRGVDAFRWEEVRRYRHYRAKTEQWRFRLHDGRRVYAVVEGLTPNETSRLAARLYLELVARGLAEPQADGRHRPLT